METLNYLKGVNPGRAGVWRLIVEIDVKEVAEFEVVIEDNDEGGGEKGDEGGADHDGYAPEALYIGAGV